MKDIQIQACASGYFGPAATVFALLDSESDVLVVSKIAKSMRRDRFQNCAIVTNADLPLWESKFTDENFPEAIAAFQRRVSEKKITFADGAAPANAEGSLQVAKIAEKGRTYELAPEINNKQIATLMIAWYADQQRSISDTFAFGDALARFSAGELLTI